MASPSHPFCPEPSEWIRDIMEAANGVGGHGGFPLQFSDSRFFPSPISLLKFLSWFNRVIQYQPELLRPLSRWVATRPRAALKPNSDTGQLIPNDGQVAVLSHVGHRLRYHAKMKTQIQVATDRRIQLKDITHRVQQAIIASDISDGVCVLFCPHTTAGLAINENADPAVANDLEKAFEAVVPGVHFTHAEGNSPAHFLSCATHHSLQIIVEDKRLQLGRWQGIYFCEFDGPRRRQLWIKMLAG